MVPAQVSEMFYFEKQIIEFVRDYIVLYVNDRCNKIDVMYIWSDFFLEKEYPKPALTFALICKNRFIFSLYFLFITFTKLKQFHIKILFGITLKARM